MSAAEHGEDAVKVERHDWWDPRMDWRCNLRFNYWLPLLCLVTGHSFTEWFGYPGHQSSWCDRCMKEATQRQSGRTEVQQ